MILVATLEILIDDDGSGERMSLRPQLLRTLRLQLYRPQPSGDMSVPLSSHRMTEDLKFTTVCNAR